MRKRFWCGMLAGACGALLFVVTLVWPDWIELVFGADPDVGDGSAEWLLTAAAVGVAVVPFVMAAMRWRRARATRALRDAN